MPWPGPMGWSSSRSGKSFATQTLPRCASSCASRSCSMAAISTSRGRWPTPASGTIQSAAKRRFQPPRHSARRRRNQNGDRLASRGLHVRTLITGGAGFIGSHLCERFLAEGHEVVCVDNFITGTPGNLDHLRANTDWATRFTFVRHDISHPLEYDGAIDNVLHFASPASPVDYLRYPIQTLKVGSLGTHNTLGLAKAKGARFLLASTSEVYGDPEQHPQREEYWGHVNPIGVRGVYDEAKRFAEAMTMAYHRYHKVDTRIIRIFNTYGERMRLDDGRALPNLM